MSFLNSFASPQNMTQGLSILANAFVDYDQQRQYTKQRKIQQDYQQTKQHHFNLALAKIAPDNPRKKLEDLATQRLHQTHSTRHKSASPNQRPKSPLLQQESQQQWQQQIAPRQAEAQATNRLETYKSFLATARQQQQQTHNEMTALQTSADQSAKKRKKSMPLSPILDVTNNLLRLL